MKKTQIIAGAAALLAVLHAHSVSDGIYDYVSVLGAICGIASRLGNDKGGEDND